MKINKLQSLLWLCLTLLLAVACQATPAEPTPTPFVPTTPEPPPLPMPTTASFLIPKPVSLQPLDSVFVLSAESRIYVPDEQKAELWPLAIYLQKQLAPATGFEMPILLGLPIVGPHFYLALDPAEAELGAEGYQLTISAEQVTLIASTPAGLFWGMQTLRQLFPPAIEQNSVQTEQWHLPGLIIRDTPRFEWRGAMLDVARHFFTVEEVKAYIDLLAYYKINRLHLHLTDDQGWRLMINSWPNLATYGGSTEVGGGEGGYYTQEQYQELVAYAEAHFMVLVPEIDLPGHTNSALASYPELNCDGVAPELYTGTEVGFSSLCLEKEETWQFIEDVIRELAALTPGPYIHIGGDEAHSTTPADYEQFIGRIQTIVQANGKQMVGWEEIGKTPLLPSSIAQHWHSESDAAVKAAGQGAKVIMSPATKVYLDMKYDEATQLGLSWAGYSSVQDAYEWDPATQLPGVGEEAILGVEAPLWSETITNGDELEFMAFPRLLGAAEIGWSPADGRDWAEYKLRLAEHGRRLEALEVNFYPSPEVDWQN